MRKSFAVFLLMTCFALVAFGVGAPQLALGQSDILTKRSAGEIEPLTGTAQGAARGGQEAAERAARYEAPLLEKAVDPDEYVLGPGDELVVSIMSTDSKTFILPVLPEGDVLIPGVGSIRADGLTLSRFRAELSTKLNQYFRNIELFCYLSAPARFRVFVTGEVGKPGAVEASGVERVTDAIAGAGGIGAIGSRRLVTLERGADTIRIDLLRFLSRGDFTANPFLRSGDRIHVPPRGCRTSIFGEVKKPGFYDVLQGETVRDLLDLAGGFTSDAMEDSVLLTRFAAEGGAKTIAIPAAEFGMPLRDMDEIGIFDRTKGRCVVHVQGAVVRTGKFVLAPNEGATDLIVRAGGFADNADLSFAYVDRRNGDVIRVNLQDILSPAPTDNVVLEDGDVLTVSAVAATVTVGGEVNKPGEFNYSGDLTVVQYIGLAGGPTKEGSVSRVVIYSPDGTRRSAHKDTHPARGDVIVVKRSTWSVAGEFFGGLIRLGTVVVSIIVLTR